MSTERPGAGELSLPQAFLLLATNDKDGEPEVPQSVLKAGLAGAILAELVWRQSVWTENTCGR